MKKEQIIEKWLEEHTFHCAMGRVSKKQCKAMQARPTRIETVRSVTSKGTYLLRPLECKQCSKKINVAKK